MCFSSGSSKTYKPAPAPVNPLPPPDAAAVGTTRTAENVQNYGQDTPSLDARGQGVKTPSNSGGIRMRT